MRTDSGSAGGQGPEQAQGPPRQCLVGSPAETLPAAGAGQGPGHPSTQVLGLGRAAIGTVRGSIRELGSGVGCASGGYEGAQGTMRK